MMPAAVVMELPTDATPVHLAAELYIHAGLCPVPVYGLVGNRCACGRSTCEESRGKHPVGGGWQKRASTDLEAARELFRAHTGNIGIVVGSDLVVVDIDYYADGRAGLAVLGEMPLTLTSQSGSGQGEHRIFRIAPGQDASEITNRKVAPGVDIKTRTGQIVVAPSVHHSGNRYRWIDLSPPAFLPDHIYEKIRTRRVVPIRPSVTTTQSAELLFKRACAYMRAIPGGVQGSGGSQSCFAAARAAWAWIEKGLAESDAWDLFLEYATRCSPPWTNEKELQHKWHDAERAERLPLIEDRNYDRPPQPPPPDDDSAPYEREKREPPSPPPPATEPDWRARLIFQRTKSGADKPAKHHENAVVVLRYHPEWKGKIQFDEHARQILVRDPPWHDTDLPTKNDGDVREWTDADTGRLSSWIRREVFELDLSVQDCDRAITIAAEANACHPFREYLDSLVWDQKSRLSEWLIAHLGARDSDYTRMVSRWWVTAAVARIYQPGCKADNVLILEGPQGGRKSSALRVLAGPKWFSDTPIDIGSKDAYLALQGKVIVELAELESLKRADAERAKAFFSSSIDRYRPPYGRREVAVPRSCVVAGTVNRAVYLVDDTGGRRYWPVRCGQINLESLEEARDALWAEAVFLYRAGVRWWPEGPNEAEVCADEQWQRSQADPWADDVLEYTGNKDEVTIRDVLKYGLKIDIGKADRNMEMRVSKLLVSLGYSRSQIRKHQLRIWVYRKVLHP